MSNQTTDLNSSALTRRIVTGNGDNGKSKVLYDDTKGHIQKLPTGSIFQTVWFTDSVPADCSVNTNEDPTGNITFRTANDGSVCTIVCLPPGAQAPMHRTGSIDYGVILEGEIELQLENGDKRLLKTGDVIVQRETVHAWRNPQSTKYTKFFTVLVASNTPGDKGFQLVKGEDSK